MDKRPILAITMGDSAGVGPEIVAKALSSKKIYSLCRPLVIGDARILSRVIESLKSILKLRPVKAAAEASGEFGNIDLIDLNNLDPERGNSRPVIHSLRPGGYGVYC